MRIIKFRAWDGSKMHYDVAIIPNQKEAVKYGHWGTSWTTEAKAGIPLQFTGLHDKNGKEIYEGDVIKLDNEPNYYVIFEKGCFLGKEIKGWDSMVDNFPIGLQSQIGEVIGNVYEHPDLLKGE